MNTITCCIGQSKTWYKGILQRNKCFLPEELTYSSTFYLFIFFKSILFYRQLRKRDVYILCVCLSQVTKLSLISLQCGHKWPVNMRQTHIWVRLFGCAGPINILSLCRRQMRPNLFTNLSQLFRNYRWTIYKLSMNYLETTNEPFRNINELFRTINELFRNYQWTI